MQCKKTRWSYCLLGRWRRWGFSDWLPEASTARPGRLPKPCKFESDIITHSNARANNLLEHVLGLGIDLDDASGGGNGRHLGDVLVATLALLLLELDGDAADGATLGNTISSLHLGMRRERHT